MPAYDYKCGTCGATKVVFKSMSKSGDIEYCDCAHFQPMQRVYTTAPAAHIHLGTPTYHPRRSK